jgi:ABC-type polar amino acid transport system ATPase subunit
LRQAKLHGCFAALGSLRRDWLKSYDCLSQGEKMRVDIAKALCLDKPLIVFAEFTRVVDREIAKVSAFAISKAVRRTKITVYRRDLPL